MKASLIDFSFAAVDSPVRNMTFAFLLTLKDDVTLSMLQEGAEKAFAAYPQSKCTLQGHKWKSSPEAFEIEVRETPDDRLIHASLQSFMDEFMPIGKGLGIKQCLFKSDKRIILASKFHHALCDGIGALLWLTVQLSGRSFINKELELKNSDKRAAKSPYAFSSKSDAFGREGSDTSGRRDWLIIDVERPLYSFKAGDFTYNDFLSAVLLKSMHQWNKEKGLGQKKMSLYMPVNIRKDAFAGFGNGASRIKIYGNADSSHKIKDYGKFIREQVRWCKDNGLWAVPDLMGVLSSIPAGLSSGFLKILSSLPSSDFCSILFSHMEENENVSTVFQKASDIKVVAPLVKQYSAAIVALSNQRKTRMTLTWDSVYLKSGDMLKLKEIFEDQYLTAVSEIMN